MKTITSWGDMREFGINFLTGEACNLLYHRYLFDVTEQGRTIIQKAFGLAHADFQPPWNDGVASIMLKWECMSQIAPIALLESGYHTAIECTNCFIGLGTNEEYQDGKYCTETGEYLTPKLLIINGAEHCLSPLQYKFIVHVLSKDGRKIYEKHIVAPRGLPASQAEEWFKETHPDDATNKYNIECLPHWQYGYVINVVRANPSHPHVGYSNTHQMSGRSM